MHTTCTQYPHTHFCSSYVTYLWPSQRTILPCHPKAQARRCILVPRFLVSGHKCNVHNTQSRALIIWPCPSGNLPTICSNWFNQLFCQPMSRTCVAIAANSFVWSHHVQSEITYLTLLMVADNLLFQENPNIKLKWWILTFNFDVINNPHILTKKMLLKHIINTL